MVHMLHATYEPQLYVPSVLVQLRDLQRRQFGVVGEEHKSHAELPVMVFDASELIGIILRAGRGAQNAALVRHQSAHPVIGMGVDAAELGVRLGAQHKVAAHAVEQMQPLEIQIGAVHHIDGAGFRHQQVQDVHIMQLGIGDVHERRDVSLQIQQRMQLDTGLGGAELGPREQRQAQVDGR